MTVSGSTARLRVLTYNVFVGFKNDESRHEQVVAWIAAQNPEVVEFNVSYRSSPAVLRTVNALAAEMQSTQLACADPDRWADEGHKIGTTKESMDGDRGESTSKVVRMTRNSPLPQSELFSWKKLGL